MNMKLFCLLMLPALMAGASETTTLTVEPNDLQQVNHWGVSVQNRPDWGAQWSIVNFSNSLDAVYKELGATIVRLNIDYDTYDKVKKREILRDAALAATERGMKWYGVPWSPPAFMKTINHVNGKVNGEINRLKPGYEDEVAAWLVDLVKWLDEQGVPLPIALDPQNEPDWNPPSYPGCIYSAEQIQTVTVELRKQLDAAGYPQILVAPNDGGAPGSDLSPTSNPNKGTVNMLGLLPGGAFETNAAFRAACGIITTHTYDLHNNLYKARPGYMKEFVDATKRAGKELWMSEWEVTHEHTHSDWEIISETVSHFNRDMSSMGFNAWMHWKLWEGSRFGAGSNDSGKCLYRIRRGDCLVYKGVGTGNNPEALRVRISSKEDKKMKLAVYLDDPDGQPVGELVIPQTASKERNFQTLEISLMPVSGVHDLYLKFEGPEHWREASLNWFSFEDGERIQAEDATEKITVEHWSSMLEDCYRMDNRKKWVYDDGFTLQKRPLFYFFKKVWNNAPADGQTVVRRMTSSSPQFQGESTAADPKVYRQDLAAFVHPDGMTVVMLNRHATEQTVNLTGLTGTEAQLCRYTETDAPTYNVDLHDAGCVSMKSGTVKNLVLPAESLTILLTNSGR